MRGPRANDSEPVWAARARNTEAPILDLSGTGMAVCARLGVQFPEKSGGLAESTGPGARGMRDMWIPKGCGLLSLLSTTNVRGG